MYCKKKPQLTVYWLVRWMPLFCLNWRNDWIPFIQNKTIWE